jgi:hypothetical protein
VSDSPKAHNSDRYGGSVKFLPVNIYPKFQVDNELVNVSKGDRDVIVWLNHHPYDVTIQFANGPFRNQEFLVPREGVAFSGPLADDAKLGTIYMYEIKNVAMDQTGDPGIKIQP